MKLGSRDRLCIPRYIRFVSGFPMTVTGKIQKYLLREQATADLGLTGGQRVVLADRTYWRS